MRLRELRRLVRIEQVLGHRGLLDGLTRRGDRLVGPCPVHGGDNPTAFVVDRRRQLWNCFTSCRGGDVVELLRSLDGTSYAEVARVLNAMARLAPPTAPPPPRTRAAPDKPFSPYTRRLTLDPRHPFLVARGVGPRIARLFEVGAWHGRGMLEGCIAVHLHDIEGQPLGYAGRRLQPSPRGKWVLPRRLPKHQLLYGWHRALTADDLVVVEGAWEVLRLQQLGIAAVALLGTHASPQQLRLLAKRRCRVLLDGDAAGRVAAQRLAEALRAPVISPPAGRDPADLSDHHLARLLARAPLLS